MDLDKTYNNPNLERRRLQIVQRNAAEVVLRQQKQCAAKPRAAVLAALTAKDLVGPLGNAIRDLKRVRKAAAESDRSVHRQLLLAVADRSSLLERDSFRTYLPAVARLLDWRPQWVREPVDWRPGTYNTARQFSSLARHLLARYDVPTYFDEAWLTDQPLSAHYRGWLVHVGQGGNLRSADNLPLSLTKLMAHHAMAAPADVSLMQALRYGQAKGLNVPERLARAVLGSRLGQAFLEPATEVFWSSVLGFFARHAMIDPNQVGPIIDYLHHQRFVPAAAVVMNGTFVQPGPPQPGLSMRGRDPETLVTQVEAWHRQLARRPKGVDLVWPPCGIPGYERVEGEPGNQRRFTVTELLGSAELRFEGAAMRHCVATYASSCRSGRTAIYSVRVLDCSGERRMVTVEVDVRNRQITQVRARYNAASTALDQRVLQAWCTVAKLTFGRFALTRAW